MAGFLFCEYSITSWYLRYEEDSLLVGSLIPHAVRGVFRDYLRKRPLAGTPWIAGYLGFLILFPYIRPKKPSRLVFYHLFHPIPRRPIAVL